MNPAEPAPQLRGILEASLYVDDLERSMQFYRSLFGFDLMVMDDRLCALSVTVGQVLLLFKKGASDRPGITDGGTIPPHDGSGHIHMAFAVEAKDLPHWEQELLSQQIPIESRVSWEHGGRSIYFRDPDNHSLELATPGTWTVY